MNNPVSIRRAQEPDAEALLALRRAVFAETTFMLWEPNEFKDTAEDERGRIARLGGQQNSACLVAEDNGELVGFLNAMGPQVNRLRHSTALAVGVLRSHWGRGIGSGLVAQALAWSKRAGLARVELTVHTSNTAAVRLYERMGFQIEGTRRHSLFVDGKCVDEYLMSRLHEV